MLSAKGKLITAAVYDTLFAPSAESVVASVKGRFGLLSWKGEWLSSPRYLKIQALKPNHLRLASTPEGHLYLLRPNKAQLQLPAADSAIALTTGYFALKAGSEWWLYRGAEADSLPFKHITKTNKHWQLHHWPQIMVISAAGDTVAHLSADSVEILNEQSLLISKNEQQLFWYKGAIRWLVPNHWQLQPYEQERFLVTTDSGHGLIGVQQKWHIQPYYKQLLPDSLGNFRAQQPNEQWVLLNRSGQQIGPQYDTLYPFKDGFYLAGTDGRWQYLLPDGTLAFQKKFVAASPFNGNYATVKPDNYWGVINHKGDYTIRPVVDSLLSLGPELFYFEDNGRSGTLLPSGIEMYKSYRPIKLRPDKLLVIDADTVLGALHPATGALWLPPLYRSINRLQPDGSVAVVLNRQKLWANMHLAALPDSSSYKQLNPQSPPSEAYMAFKQNNRWGFTDVAGRIRVTPQYELVKPFNNGLAAVQLNGNWGYINKREQLVVQPYFQEVMPAILSGEKKILTLPVRTEAGWQLVTPSQPTLNLLKGSYAYLWPTEHGNWLVWEKGKWGLQTLELVSSIPAHYTAVKDLGRLRGSGFAEVQLSDSYGISRYDGSKLLAPVYQRVRLEQGLFVGYLPAPPAELVTF